MEEFGSIGAILARPHTMLPNVVSRLDLLIYIRSLAELLREALRCSVTQPIQISDLEALRSYLHLDAAYRIEEVVRVIFLNVSKYVIRNEVMWTGTVDRSPLYVREIIKRALAVGASSIIVVHNHPSGDPRPSPLDLSITKLLSDAGKRMDLTLLDHIIVASSGYFSMREAGVI